MLQINAFANCATAQLKADGTQTFCADTLQWERKRWMVCMHDIGMAGLVSDENYALWVAMYGTRPGASYELMVLDCTLFSDLLTWVHKAKQLNPARFGVGTPTEMQRTLVALWSANVPSSPRMIEDVCRMMRWLLAIVRLYDCMHVYVAVTLRAPLLVFQQQ